MRIACQVQHLVSATPQAAFALSTDPVRFAVLFDGYGPIPALRSIDMEGPARVGTVRRLHSRDGTCVREEVTALEPGRLHAYRLSGLAPPFAWLVRHGDAEWRFEPVGGGTRVVWRYDFLLTSPLAAPLAAPLLHGFMARAMHRCLRNLGVALSTASTAMEATP